MSGTPADVIRARTEAAAARARIDETVARLKHRLSPKVRAQEVWEDLREKGEEFGDDALEFAYDRPAIVAGGAAATLLLLIRRPIIRLARRLIFWRRPKWDVPPALKNPAGTVNPLPGKGGVKP